MKLSMLFFFLFVNFQAGYALSESSKNLNCQKSSNGLSPLMCQKLENLRSHAVAAKKMVKEQLASIPSQLFQKIFNLFTQTASHHISSEQVTLIVRQYLSEKYPKLAKESSTKDLKISVSPINVEDLNQYYSPSVLNYLLTQDIYKNAAWVSVELEVQKEPLQILYANKKVKELKTKFLAVVLPHDSSYQFRIVKIEQYQVR